MTKKVLLSFSEQSMRTILDFSKGDFILLGDIAKIMSVLPKTLEAWSNQQNGAFPPIVRFGDLGWKHVSRNDLLQWFVATGTKDPAQYANYAQKYFTTRDLADECKIRPDQVLDYVKWGIVKPLSDASFRQFTIEQVDILKAYLVEQRTKEDKARADAKQKFNDGMKAAYDKMGENFKNQEEAKAEREARRKASIESEVDNYRKSISGGTR